LDDADSPLTASSFLVRLLDACRPVKWGASEKTCLEMPEDDHLELSYDSDDDLPNLLREVERMVALGRAFALCVSDEQLRELTLIYEWLRPNPGGPLQ
jgi:hypothetical protein